jgi:DNA-binding transcriptional ArsR family regulator
VRRCRIGRDLKAVAYSLAQYGDKHGQNIRPGVPRLAAVCEMGESTLRRRLKQLREMGLVEVLSHGGGPNGDAARYRLTVPTDLLERVPMLAADERTPLAGVLDRSEVRNPGRPVDNGENSARGCAGSERSSEVAERGTPLTSGGNSARFGPELRSPMGERLPRDHPNTPPKTSPEVSTSPASSTASRPGPSPPLDQAAARPVATQPAFWPAAAPDLPDGEHRCGPGELRTRYAAARSRDRPA